MCGNGVVMHGMSLKMVKKPIRFTKVTLIRSACFAAVAGTTARGAVVCRAVTPTSPAAGAATLASASSFPSEPLPKDLKLQERSGVLAANGKGRQSGTERKDAY